MPTLITLKNRQGNLMVQDVPKAFGKWPGFYALFHRRLSVLLVESKRRVTILISEIMMMEEIAQDEYEAMKTRAEAEAAAREKAEVEHTQKYGRIVQAVPMIPGRRR